MALEQKVFPSMKGMLTSISRLSRDPASLVDCLNVVYTRTGSVQSRKGHPVYWAPSTSSAGYNEEWAKIWTKTEQEDVFRVAWTGSSKGKIGALDASKTWSGNVCYQYITLSSGTTRTEAEATTDRYYPAWSWYSGTDVTGWSVPRIIEGVDNQYVMAANGWFRTGAGTFDKFKRVIPATVSQFSVVTVNTSTEANWLLPGYQVRLVAVVRERVSNDTEVHWSPSHETIVKNVQAGSMTSTRPLSLTATVVVNSANLEDLEDAFIEVYRTEQYPISESATPPTNFYFVDAQPLSRATAVSNTQTTHTIPLGFNDDFIRGNAKIYFNANYLLQTSPTPTARSVVSFKGYAILSNLTLAPSASLAITSVPVAASALSIVSAGETITQKFRNFANSSNAPGTDGYLTYWSAGNNPGVNDVAGTASFSGVSTSTYDLILRMAVSSTTNVAAGYNVPPDLTTAYKLQIRGATAPGSSSSTKTVKIVPEDGGTFDIAKFTAPGFMAVVQAGSSVLGRVVDLVYYEDIEIIATTGKVELLGAVSKANWTSTIYDDSVTPVAYTDKLYLVYIPGTTDRLPVYEIGADAETTVNKVKGFSLLPTWYQYPIQLANQQPVGVIEKFSFSGSSAYKLQATIRFLGIEFRSLTTQLALACEWWAREFNAQRTVFSPSARFEVRDSVAKFIFQGQGVGNGTAGALETTFEAYKDSTGFSTEPDIGVLVANKTDLLFGEGTQVPNGVVVTRQNRPEMITTQQALAPQLVGNDSKEILNAAVTYDAVYLFKKEEGIYRMDIDDNLELAFTEGIPMSQFMGVQLIDNTTWLIASESVQEINDGIYFLSNKGICVIAGNSVAVISEAIDIEVREAITKCKVAGLLDSVRSFGNEIRKLYGVTIPFSASTSVTYVLDITTGQFGKWDVGFKDAMVTQDGRLLTVFDDTTYTSGWNVIRRDQYTVGMDDDVDQYDFSIALTGATFSTTDSVVTITRNTSTAWLGEIGYVADLVGEASQVYFKDATDDALYRCTVNKVSSSSITLTFLDETPPTPSTSDTIVIGVRVVAKTNRFYPSGPGARNQFSKFHLYIPGRSDFVKVGFDKGEGEESQTLFANSTLSTYTTKYDRLTGAVELRAARGSSLAMQVQHDYPYQSLSVDGYTIIYRPIRSDRIEGVC